MSTRSNIGILNLDNTVEMIYCHSDGYPSYNGKMLLEHYSNTEKVRELMALGDISSLGSEIGVKHGFDSDFELARRNGWTRAYGRDRGEQDVASRKKLNVVKAIKQMEEYLYLWSVKDAAWKFTDGSSPLVTLTKAACKD